MADWLTIDAVFAWLYPGAGTADPLDANLVLATDAVAAEVERVRSDLFTADTPPVFVPGAQVHAGSVMWAANIYQLRSSPSGAAGFDETMVYDSLGSRRAEILRLIGYRRPLTA